MADAGIGDLRGCSGSPRGRVADGGTELPLQNEKERKGIEVLGAGGGARDWPGEKMSRFLAEACPPRHAGAWETGARAKTGCVFPKEPEAEQHDSATRTGSPLISALNKKRVKEWVSGEQSARYVVMLATDAFSSMGDVFAFALMLRSVHLSHMTWMCSCVPRCPLIWEYYLFLERLIILEE